VIGTNRQEETCAISPESQNVKRRPAIGSTDVWCKYPFDRPLFTSENIKPAYVSNFGANRQSIIADTASKEPLQDPLELLEHGVEW
jgi:hypothetical protein